MDAVGSGMLRRESSGPRCEAERDVTEVRHVKTD
jgi:hypothetical protein